MLLRLDGLDVLEAEEAAEARRSPPVITAPSSTSPREMMESRAVPLLPDGLCLRDDAFELQRARVCVREHTRNHLQCGQTC